MEPLGIRITMSFLAFLTALFILALIVVPRLPPVDSASIPTPAPLVDSNLPTPGLPCKEISMPFLEQMLPLYQEWQDTTKVAGSAPTTALSGHITTLQGVRRRVQALQPPPCVVDVQQNLDKAMEAAIQGYISALEQKPDADTQVLFAKSDDFFALYRNALRRAVLPPTPVPEG